MQVLIYISFPDFCRIEKREDRECLVGGYFLFDINVKEIFNIDETVTLELTFDRARFASRKYEHADFGIASLAS